MGTEILRPQDCLVRPVPSLLNRRRFSPNNPSPRNKFSRNAPTSPETRRQRESSKPQKLVNGQVTILKRGEPIEEKIKGKLERSCTASDAAVFGEARLRLAPAIITKEIRLICISEDEYAGSAFSTSPSPRALPIPTFPKKDSSASSNVVDHSATRGLRRLLRLE
ncbi:hypothetical protein HPP92_024989 [Vanilla planifolia]|uniref:Uncharacterized protein n=1 Tax=Vanilla planifolia TaxID=51239 RepID=A0A835UA69_VANPL|nr:hypothetical protein HPP92_024989 [Vanilla planifolia]